MSKISTNQIKEESMNKNGIKSALITACGYVLAAIIGAITAIVLNVVPPRLDCQKQLKLIQEQLKKTQDSLYTEQAKVAQLTIHSDRLNKDLDDCVKSLTGLLTLKEILNNLTKEGKQIKNNCTQPNIAIEFDKWKIECINQLTRYIPNIQDKIEDNIKNAPPNNCCVKTESIINLLESLKKE